MILTTTPNVPGHEVSKVLGLVFGTDIYLVGGFLGGGLANQEGLFSSAMEIAEKHLIDRAEQMGADAVIGLQTSFTSPGNLNEMVLVLTGTAVKFYDTGKEKVADQTDERREIQRQAIEKREAEEQETSTEQPLPEFDNNSGPDNKRLLAKFVEANANTTSVKQLQAAWEASGFNNMPEYENLTNEIQVAAGMDQKYVNGRRACQRIINDIKDLLK